MRRKIILSLLAILVIIQFFHPEKNLGGDQTSDIATQYHVPGNVHLIFEKACEQQALGARRLHECAIAPQNGLRDEAIVYRAQVGRRRQVEHPPA